MSLAFFGGAAAVTNPNLKGLLMNVNTAATRGTVFSLVTLTDDVGKGLGPEVVALAVSACGRRVALSGAISCWWGTAFRERSVKLSMIMLICIIQLRYNFEIFGKSS